MFNLTPWRRTLPARREEVGSLQREMNRLFEDFFRGSEWEGFMDFPAAQEKVQGDVAVRMDMSETEKELIAKVELPGLNEKDVNISIDRDTLTVSGEKKQEKEEKEKGWYRMERQYGYFSRSLQLPTQVDPDKSAAVYKDGVLTVTMPKVTANQKSAKTIAVKSA